MIGKNKLIIQKKLNRFVILIKNILRKYNFKICIKYKNSFLIAQNEIFYGFIKFRI